MATPTPTTYDLHLKGYVGDWNFDADYVDWVIGKNAGRTVNVLIDSLGGSLKTALSVAAAFSRHGDVRVHYSGMNASAATIAGMGAARITIDPSALWLVHKSSLVLDIWSKHNSTDMAQLIEQLEAKKRDLETFDRAVAEMYARRCSKTPQELAALMAEERWLTAQEAVDWGFADEVAGAPGSKADGPEARASVPESVLMAMEEAGIPLPPGMEARHEAEKPGVIRRVINFLRAQFPDSSEAPNAGTDCADGRQAEAPADPDDSHNPDNPTAMAETIQTPGAAAPANDEIAQLRARLEAAEARVAELEGAPGADTTAVVDTSHRADARYADVGQMARYADEMAQARALFNNLP